MKKSYNPVADVRNDSVEGVRRLYRAITDIARNLDESKDRAQSCTELFLPNAETQRGKLRDYCERLIFTDPLGFGRKGEELLWRKGYYDVVTTSKRLRKNNAWKEDEKAHLQRHLYAGVGHYYHIIFRLQIEFRLDLHGVVDFPLLINDGGLTKGKAGTSRCQEEGCREWSRQALHRCLVFLGDLSRYLLELHPEWDSGLPQRYYMQAINLNSDFGMPHNQLGTLAGSQNYSVDAAYHYMRCLSCPHSFEGAEGNLRRIFERNAKWLEHHDRWNLHDKQDEMPPTERIHRFVARFMVVLDVWFFDKNFPANPSQLCQQMVEDLRHCLLYSKQFPSDIQISPEHLDLEELLSFNPDGDAEKPEYLKDDVVFKLVAMLLLCASRLQLKRSKLLSGLMVFTLAVVSEIVQQVINHIQDSVLSLSVPSDDHHYTPETSLTPENNEPSNENVESDDIPSSSVSLPEEKMIIIPSCDDKKLKPKENGKIDITPEKEVKKKRKEKKKLRLLSKFRRRRPRVATHNSSEDSDYSDGDMPYGNNTSSDDGNGDISENDEHLIYDDVDDDDDEDSEDSSISTRVESKDTINDEGILIEKKETITNGDCQSENASEESNENLLVNGSCSNSVEDSHGTCKPLSVEENKKSNELIETDQEAEKEYAESNRMDVADILELVTEEGLLQIVKISADWLVGEKEIIKACGRSSPTFLKRIVTMLNLINIDAEVLKKRSDSSKFLKLKNIPEIFLKVPLMEDVQMKGVALLKTAHEAIDWEFSRNQCLHTKEEALLRVYKLVNFGNFLASIEETKITFDKTKNVFEIHLEPSKDVNSPTINGVAGSGASSPRAEASSPAPAAATAAAAAAAGVEGPEGPGGAARARAGGGGGGGDLLQHMGQLWLRAQVRELETRVRRQGRRGVAALSPYLAVDCDALTAHMALVRQLVAARRFIVLVPAVVVSALDELKREVGRAREAIRWLEAQFQRGNRFLRAQRHHERLPLPLIKYPKRKDRDAWFFFQIVECCYYFTQQNGVHELTPETSLVTLLTGQAGVLDDPNRAYSPLGVARAAGVNLEHIEAFHAKWKTSSKSHG